MGRKSKDTPQNRRIILDNLRDCVPLKYASRLAGVDPDSVYNWMKADPNFSAQVAAAKSESVRGCVIDVRKADPWKILKNIARDEFTDTHHVVEEDPLDKMTDDELVDLAKKALARAKGGKNGTTG